MLILYQVTWRSCQRTDPLTLRLYASGIGIKFEFIKLYHYENVTETDLCLCILHSEGQIELLSGDKNMPNSLWRGRGFLSNTSTLVTHETKKEIEETIRNYNKLKNL